MIAKKENKGLEPIEDQSINLGLAQLIDEYWEKNKVPEFKGYYEKKNGTGVRRKEKKRKKPLKQVHQKRKTSPNSQKDSAVSEESVVKATRRGRYQRKKEKKKNIPLRIFVSLCTLLAVFVVTVVSVFLVLQYQGEKQLKASNVTDEEITGVMDAELSNGGKTVVYHGETYEYNENISTILCMGVDREEYNEEGTYGEGGQADAIFMIVLDNETGQTTMLPVSRNTMVEIDEYNPDGTYQRQNEVQIALAYTYGDGREKSCENVAKAVSRLLYGMPVSSYATIDLSAITTLNDGIGGVEVEVLEDLSLQDPELKAGSVVTLKGQQAEIYVRSRKTEGYDLEVDNNMARMERQQQYMGAFMKKTLRQTRKNPTLPVRLFQSVKEDMVTDITTAEVAYFASLLVQHGLNNSIVPIPGKAKKGEYTEVYVKNNELYQIILDTFYTKQG